MHINGHDAANDVRYVLGAFFEVRMGFLVALHGQAVAPILIAKSRTAHNAGRVLVQIARVTVLGLARADVAAPVALAGRRGLDALGVCILVGFICFVASIIFEDDALLHHTLASVALLPHLGAEVARAVGRELVGAEQLRRGEILGFKRRVVKRQRICLAKRRRQIDAVANAILFAAIVQLVRTRASGYNCKGV